MKATERDIEDAVARIRALNPMWTIPDPKALVQLLIGQGCKPVFTREDA